MRSRESGTAGQWTRAIRITALLLASGGASCARGDRGPSASEPHAVVKLTLKYATRPGPQLHQEVTQNGRAIEIPAPRPPANVVQHSLRVAPETTNWHIATKFSHTVETNRPETYQVEVGTMCGGGRMVCKHWEARSRVVREVRRFRDGGCDIGLAQLPQRDGVYQLEYEFLGDGRCSLTCGRQWVQPDGSTKTTPCEQPPASPAPAAPRG